MTEERTRYRERTSWARWVDLVYLAVVLWGAYSVAAALERPIVLRLAVTAAVLAAGWGLRAVLGGLTVLVQETRIVMHLGTVGLLRKAVSFDTVASLESLRYRPVAEFGGWGVRGWGKKQAWTARGNRALLIGLGEGRRLYVGSDNPERLEKAIRSAMAERDEQRA